MDKGDWLAARFQQQRPRLTAVAYRMLGSPSEADDVVQEAWLRLNRADASAVEDLGSWLTTVVSRLCLNVLQARRSRPEVPLDMDMLEEEPVVGHDSGTDPEEQVVLADSVGLALLVVLDTLTPAERVAFVLHDMFAVPFEEVAPILGRSSDAARQLASRARRRVQGRGTDRDVAGLRQSKLVDAFLAAARNGQFSELLALLDPDVVLRADERAVKLGAAQELRGAAAVAAFARRAQGAKPALVNGAAGAVWMPGGRPRVVFAFTTSGDKITSIDLIADPERLRQTDLVIPSE